MQEQQHQIKIYGFFQKLVYFIVVMDCLSLLFINKDIFLVSEILRKFSSLGFYPPTKAKFVTILLISLVAIGTRAKKKQDLNVIKEVVLPIIAGLLIIFTTLSIAFTIQQEQKNNSLTLLHKIQNKNLNYVQDNFSIVISNAKEIPIIEKKLKGKKIQSKFILDKENNLKEFYLKYKKVIYASKDLNTTPKIVQNQIIKNREKEFFGIWEIAYIILSFLGAIVTQVGADNISKYMQTKIAKDRWNTEEESFEQNTELVVTPTSINIPYQFRYKNKVHDGWLNINPFRGSYVIGTPGSGKSFGIINPSIRQMMAKGFCCCIYDYKFPDLTSIAYYQYLKKKQVDKDYNHKFHIINLNDIRYSRRVNPFKREYIQSLAEAQEISQSMVFAMQKGGSTSGGSDQFFTQSAINYLSACIYFFAKFENGKFSTLPHILAFMNAGYDEMFDTLFYDEDIRSLLSPFYTAYVNKAFNQLEGQIGTIKIFLSRLDTKESNWVFSGDDIDLFMSNPKEPSTIILASHPNTQDINSALFSAILNRVLTLINTKNNLPSAIIADELPTIYIHKLDNVVATARSNKVAVLLGLQERPQLKQYYKKEVADTISAIVGNVFAGSVRDKETLDSLEKMFGKIKQKTYSTSISQQGTTQTINEKMDSMIPSGKMASLRTGEMVGVIAQGEENQTLEYKTSTFSGKINLPSEELNEENSNMELVLKSIPKYYDFEDIDALLEANKKRIQTEVKYIIKTIKQKKQNEES